MQTLTVSIDKLKKMYETGIIEPDKKVELVEGEIIMMAPIGFRHAKTLERLERKLYEIISKSKKEYIVWSQNPVKISDTNLLYPDIVLFPESIYQNEDIPHIKDAILVIEISDSTLEYDKNTKLPIYAKANVKEVWIVNLKDNLLEKYTNPSGNIFKDIHIHKKEDKVELLGDSFYLSEIL